MRTPSVKAASVNHGCWTAGARTRSVVQLSEAVILCVDEIAWHASLSQVTRQVLDHRRRTTNKHVHIHNPAMDRAHDSIDGEMPCATRENVMDAYERQFGAESGVGLEVGPSVCRRTPTRP